MAEYKYNMSYRWRGTCIIVNNVEFSPDPVLYPDVKLDDRTGSDLDADNMEKLFKSLGFQVIKKKNQTANQMKQFTIDVASKLDHSESDCFAMVILSHGEDLGLVWGVDDKLQLKDIFDPLKLCKGLVGKPKLFFVQACRGGELDEGVELPPRMDTDAVNDPEKPPQPPQSIPLEADFFYAYSTPPGHYSFRSGDKGAWFIQAIYRVFTQHHADMELMHMMIRVNHMVAHEFTSNCRDPSFDKKKQVSSAVSMLTKELYFTPKPEQPTPA